VLPVDILLGDLAGYVDQKGINLAWAWCALLVVASFE
jgi:hypothetical protein